MLFYILESDNSYIALSEMKTKEEYARRSFKKKYNFIPDKPGSNTGYITIDGEKQKVNLNGISTEAELGGDKTINLDKNFFNLKGSHHNERRDAMLQHERGHIKLHDRSKDNNVDSKNATMHVYKGIGKNRVDNKIKHLSNKLKSVGIDGLTKSEKHQIRNKEYNTRKAPDQMIASEYYKNTTKNKDDIKRRNKDWDTAAKHAKYEDYHDNPMEIEADRYSANRTSSRAMKKALHNDYKIGERYIKRKFKYDNNSFATQEKDQLRRSKALKDPELINAKTYKK